MVETQIPFVDLKTQYASYQAELDDAIMRVVKSCRFIQGGEVEALEQELAAFSGAAHCVSCASGTDALLLALMALDIGPGDEVITTPFSFFATAEAISLVGATPVFVDIQPETYNIDPTKIESAITHHTRGVLPVGIFGQPADMDAINQIAVSHAIAVIEDAAQSFGARYHHRRSGTLAQVGCTSFFPAKPLGCFGDGGAVFTEDDELGNRIRQLMNHGQTARYEHGRIGLNARLDAIQAAVLRVKLRHYADELVARERIAQRYTQALRTVAGIRTPTIAPGMSSSFAQYTIVVQDRDQLVAALTSDGVPTAIHYPAPLYSQPVYRLGRRPSRTVPAAGCEVAESVCGRVMSIPFGPFLATDHQDRIIDAVLRFLEERPQ